MVSFEVLYKEWLELVFPHISAFRTCRAPKAVRVIWLPKTSDAKANIEGKLHDGEVERFAEEIYDGLQKSGYVEKYGKGCVLILKKALELFERITGGKDRIVVYVSKAICEMPDRTQYDIGVYDHRFAVWARRNGDDYHRKINWYYIHDIEELNIPILDNEDTAIFKKGLAILKGSEVDRNDNVTEEIETDDSETSYSRFSMIVENTICKKFEDNSCENDENTSKK